MKKFRNLKIKKKLVHLEKLNLMIYHLNPSVIPEGRGWDVFLVEKKRSRMGENKISKTGRKGSYSTV